MNEVNVNVMVHSCYIVVDGDVTCDLILYISGTIPSHAAKFNFNNSNCLVAGHLQ